MLEEAGKGDQQAAKARLEALTGFLILKPGPDTAVIAGKMVEELLIPREYINDAIHVSIAATNGIDYLVTWNCRHLANAITRSRMLDLIEASGYVCPVICTPEELMEDAP